MERKKLRNKKSERMGTMLNNFVVLLKFCTADIFQGVASHMRFTKSLISNVMKFVVVSRTQLSHQNTRKKSAGSEPTV